MNWLEVSLIVNGELAEAVAEVLARFAPSGVAIESGVTYHDDEDEGSPDGAVRVHAYLPMNEKTEETRQKLEEALHYLNMIQPLPSPVFEPIADQNWMEAWKEHYQPIPIGKRFIIIPAWLESPDEKRIPIRIDPGMAFGTGTHPTTQLCLELIETFFEQSSNINYKSSIIDIGCGSGILSIAALKLGAASALGVDIDEMAIKVARKNAEINNIVAGQFTLCVGSVAEILSGKFGIRNAPLVLVNILAPVIIRLFHEGLANLVTPDGSLILSGILAEQAESVILAAQAHEAKLVENRQSGDWVALVFHYPFTEVK